MLIRGLFRTLRLCLEAMIGLKVPIDHPLIPWLLQHTALLLSVQSRLPDGLTPWARVRGRPFSQKILGVGEMVMYKLPSKGPNSQPDGNMGAKWKEGVFLGYSKGSNTYIVGTESGTVTSRTLTRLPEQTRWNAEILARIKSTPWSERQAPDPEVRFQDPASTTPDVETSAPAAPRRIRIQQADLEKHGYTDTCQQCQHIMRYGRARSGVQH